MVALGSPMQEVAQATLALCEVRITGARNEGVTKYLSSFSNGRLSNSHKTFTVFKDEAIQSSIFN